MRRLPWPILGLTGLGLLLIGSGIALSARDRSAPGTLRAREDVILWQAADGPRSPDGKSARVRFRLENRGGTPVRIVSVQSSCDCSVPSVEPRIVPPGGGSTVAVEATPPALGEQAAVITVRTDSPITPEIPLRLQMRGKFGGRQLVQAGGDLAFQGDWSPKEPRELIVVTTEERGAPRSIPRIDCDLPFFTFALKDVQERDTMDRGTVLRTYTFDVTCAFEPSPGLFDGEVRVRDAWGGSKTLAVPVHGAYRPPVQVVPPRLILAVGPGQAPPEAELWVLTRDGASDYVAEVEGGVNSPLRVERRPAGEQGSNGFRVSLKSPRTGLFHVIIRREPSPGESYRVPVLIRGGGPT